MTKRHLALELAVLLVLGNAVSAADDATAWLQACAKAAAADATVAITGEKGWLFLGSELRHLGAGKFWGKGAAKVSRAAKPEWADPLPAILDFHAQLDKLGIELLLVPVPAKAVVYPDKLSDVASPEGARPDFHHAEFYKLLAKRGINVLDLTPQFRAARKDEATAGPLFCRRDTHWSPRACVLTAGLIARQAARKPWFAAVPKRKFQTEERELTITGDLARSRNPDKPAAEKLPARHVGLKEGKLLQPVATDPASPVLLLGDSHCLVFHTGGDMHARGVGLADQLAAELGFAVDEMGVRGSGATAARIDLYRKAKREPDYIAGKKLIVWCFSAREFTEADGWRKVPVTK
jgi:acetyltransferase AlgX (SGNH hydrolase-like protein)